MKYLNRPAKSKTLLKPPRRPNYWLLDLFVCGMIALGIILMQAHIARQWEPLIDTGWAAIAIAGMSIWVWANWSALCDEDHRQDADRKHRLAGQSQPGASTQAQTPVQRHFLATMRRYSRR